MFPLNEYLRPALITLLGSAFFAADILVFGVLLGGKLSGVGFIGFGVALAGAAGLTGTWQERRLAVRTLEERQREIRLAERLDQLNRRR